MAGLSVNGGCGGSSRKRAGHRVAMENWQGLAKGSSSGIYLVGTILWEKPTRPEIGIELNPTM